jgi:hypothetical protein
MSSVQKNLKDGRVVAMVESLKAMDRFYGITSDERHVLDVIHGVSDFVDESEE